MPLPPHVTSAQPCPSLLHTHSGHTPPASRCVPTARQSAPRLQLSPSTQRPFMSSGLFTHAAACLRISNRLFCDCDPDSSLPTPPSTQSPREAGEHTALIKTRMTRAATTRVCTHSYLPHAVFYLILLIITAHLCNKCYHLPIAQMRKLRHWRLIKLGKYTQWVGERGSGGAGT